MGSRRLTPEEVDAGLLQMTLTGRNAAEASRRLKFAGHTISVGHLRRLPDLHRERFREIQNDYAPRVAAKVAEEALDIAMRAAEGERVAIAASIEQVRKGEARDPAAVARNLATVKGINVDKSQLLRGQPTEVRETRSAAEIAKALCARVGIQYDPAEPLPQTLRRLGVDSLAKRAEAGRPTAEVVDAEEIQEEP